MQPPYHPPPPNLYVEALTNSVAVFGNGISKEFRLNESKGWGHDPKGLVSLSETREQTSPPPLAQMKQGHKRAKPQGHKAALRKPARPRSSEPNHTGTLTLASKIVPTAFCYLSVCGILLWQPKERNKSSTLLSST